MCVCYIYKLTDFNFYPITLIIETISAETMRSYTSKIANK